MQLKINGKDYRLIFGLSFIEEIDKVMGITKNEVSFGLGLANLSTQLASASPVAIKKAIKAGVNTLDFKPTDSEIEEFLMSDECDLNEVAEGFLGQFEKSKAIKKTMESMQKAFKKREQQMEATK